MIEILPDVWMLKTSSVKYINDTDMIHINCSSDLTYIGTFTNHPINEQSIFLKKEIVSLYNYIHNALKKIHKGLELNKVILISCNTCKLLSPLIILSYFIYYGKMNINEAVIALESKIGTFDTDTYYFDSIIKKIYMESKK